ncbi:GNAT family N-acetyltransferase [Rhodobacter lacus]|uniref:GNAT family N-acetyltransferase n=1 Tax=Rhodobacter lacus TaxID=1641972 RepID=A0ABW5A4C1_9RHOB
MIRPATPLDAAAIAAIYNAAVRETTAIWNTTEVDAADRADWIAARAASGLPVLVFEAAGAVLGYATYGPFRPQDGFCATVEHSVYLAAEARGAGRGAALMAALIAHARGAGVHVMVAAIDASNAPSMRLHERLGFAQVGVMPQVGQKFGRWLDLALLQLVLDERPQP